MSRRNKNRMLKGLLAGNGDLVNKAGLPLAGRGRMSGAIDGGSMAEPVMINLTKHLSSEILDFLPENREIGFTVRDLRGRDRERLLQLQDFNDGVPDITDIRLRANEIVKFAILSGAKYAWVGGAPYLLVYIISRLKKSGIIPVFSYSRRDYMQVCSPESLIAREIMYREHTAWVILDDLDD